jgi:hypothetical protein
VVGDQTASIDARGKETDSGYNNLDEQAAVTDADHHQTQSHHADFHSCTWIRL